VSLVDAASTVLLIAGAVFFFAGTCGLLRFPDVYSRLHALTKVDNLGLGLLVMGLSLQADNGFVVAKLLLIWALVLAASATSACLIAGGAHRHGIEPEQARRSGRADERV
jgi:multicomponent Na+:H+ antiporter subunit G